MHSSNKALVLTPLMVAVSLTGCTATATHNPALPVGEAAYQVIPATVPAPSVYTIVPRDVLQVRVYGEPDLSVEKARVDDAGFIQLPMAGQISAAGLSADELTKQVTAVLGRKYLRNPQVAVSVDEAAPRYVSVEGEVKMPGVYELTTNTTLLGALARAQSPLVTAKLDQIVIFRTINGQRMAARFNVKDIRTGISPDPIVMDGDVVMVGYSRISGAWQDFLKMAPIFNIFAVVATRN
ncbi:polysaccharide export outer membrane protein [Novosphingobium sp. PhB165]|uniref:polysaccharide biosynthesis/export family protein n=1 Tax=Novosphingobium sp. PhB165 TaxID=2485105 RepID=UPI0010EACDDE|nr:polysaccharide biosynthesis/export family protein [Novosphingobium sp. PhB165]TCM17828.1 polysaccharide export outer membrane protein [Novosphingobium sp. PhB165]